MITAYITHSDCARHDVGSWHPESPQRLAAIAQQLERSGLAQDLLHYDAPLATQEQLSRAHPRAHLRSLDLSLPEEGIATITEDTLMCPDTLLAAQRAAGAVVRATERVLNNQADNAFCAVRPPGHHAERVESMGFCYYNNVAIGAAHAIHQFGIERAAILDFDVHHGNGTVDIFKDNPNVLLCSSFQHPFYPFRYTERNAWDNIVNTPLAAGTRSADFRKAIERDWLPALQRFKPQIIFISAGFDAHKLDPIGQLQLDDDDYYWITRLIADTAAQYSNNRIVSVLEGGYDLSALGRSVHRHLEALRGY